MKLANDDAYDSVSALDVDKRNDIALLKIKAVNLPTSSWGIQMQHRLEAPLVDSANNIYNLGIW